MQQPAPVVQIRKMYPVMSGICKKTYKCQCGVLTANDKRLCPECLTRAEMSAFHRAKENADRVLAPVLSSPLFVRRSRRAYRPR